MLVLSVEIKQNNFASPAKTGVKILLTNKKVEVEKTLIPMIISPTTKVVGAILDTTLVTINRKQAHFILYIASLSFTSIPPHVLCLKKSIGSSSLHLAHI